jgi:hypothetical protein
MVELCSRAANVIGGFRCRVADMALEYDDVAPGNSVGLRKRMSGGWIGWLSVGAGEPKAYRMGRRKLLGFCGMLPSRTSSTG